MKFLKNLKRYLRWNDNLFFISLSAFLGACIDVPISCFAFNKTFDPFIFTSISFFLYSLFLLLHFTEEKKVEKKVWRRMSFLSKIIDNHNLEIKHDEFIIKKIIVGSNVTFEFRDKIGFTFLEFIYDKKTKEITRSFVSKSFQKYSNTDVDKMVDSIIDFIKYEESDLPVEEQFKDEITFSIDTLREMCFELSNDKNSFNFEEIHLLNESLPSELARLREIYLSFSDSGKVKHSENVKETMKEIKHAIDTLRDKSEGKKIEELEKMKNRIHERVAKRVNQ